MKEDAWYVKLGLGAAAVAAIYVAFLAVRGATHRAAARTAKPLDFRLVNRFDFAGQSFSARREALGAFTAAEPGLTNFNLLQSLRGIVCLMPPSSEQAPVPEEASHDPGDSQFLSYELDSSSGPPVALVPHWSHQGDYLFLLIAHNNVKGIESPVLTIKRGDRVLQQLSMPSFKPVPVAQLGAIVPNAPVVIQKLSSEPDTSVVWASMRPHYSPSGQSHEEPQYVVRLKSPVPSGERAFVRLLRTEYDAEPQSGEWTEIGGSGAFLFSPIGPLASRALIELVFCKPSNQDETVEAPLGKIAVRFGQPTFLAEKPRSIRLTSSLSLGLPEQGAVLRRPSQHPKRTILISGAIDTLRTSEQIPDSLARIRWLSPEPSDLGLETIYFPWGKVHSTAPVTAPLKNGSLTAKLDVSFVRWDVARRQTLVVPIQSR